MELTAFQCSNQRQRFDDRARLVGIGQSAVTRTAKIQCLATIRVKHGVVADRQHLAGPGVDRYRRTRRRPSLLHRTLQLPVLRILKPQIETQRQCVTGARLFDYTKIPYRIAV